MRIDLTKADYKKLKFRKIGQGSEGIVYRYGDGLLIKLYFELIKPNKNKVLVKDYILDENGTKIVCDKNRKIEEIMVDPLHFEKDKDGVKIIYSTSQIKMAMSRQKNIESSKLPLGPVYLENRFVGPVLYEHKKCKDIHKINRLPDEEQFIIFNNALDNQKELCDNFVYPVDFAYRSDDRYRHSNILYDSDFNAHFIDLEGASTVYMHKFNKVKEMESYYNFYCMFLNIRYGITVPNEDTHLYESFYEDYLISKGVHKKYTKYWDESPNLNYGVLKNMLSDTEAVQKRKSR